MAFGATADVQLTEGGTEIVRIQNSHVLKGDTSEHGADLLLGLQDRLTGMHDSPTRARAHRRHGQHRGRRQRPACSRRTTSSIGDSAGTVVVMNALPPDPDNPPEPGDPTVSGALALLADNDQDEKGAIRDGVAGAAGGVLDRRGNAQEAGVLIAIASDGIGESGNPLVTTGGGSIAILNGDATTPLNGGSGGIYCATTAAATSPSRCARGGASARPEPLALRRERAWTDPATSRSRTRPAIS